MAQKNELWSLGYTYRVQCASAGSSHLGICFRRCSCHQCRCGWWSHHPDTWSWGLPCGRRNLCNRSPSLQCTGLGSSRQSLEPHPHAAAVKRTYIRFDRNLNIAWPNCRRPRRLKQWNDMHLNFTAFVFQFKNNNLLWDSILLWMFRDQKFVVFDTLANRETASEDCHVGNWNFRRNNESCPDLPVDLASSFHGHKFSHVPVDSNITS